MKAEDKGRWKVSVKEKQCIDKDITTEEKASEIVFKIQNSGSLDYDGRRAKYMYEAAMEMAQWKDQQLADYLQQERDKAVSNNN